MNEPAIQPGDELRCPHCRKWPPLVERPCLGETDYSAKMLFFECSKGFYYGGQIGESGSRFETRRVASRI
jgi:hypothetical protein